MGDVDERCRRRDTIQNIVKFLENHETLDDGEQKDQVNIDDICDVIDRDPSFHGGACAADVVRPLSDKPFLVIIEQPAVLFRFRYTCECDLRSAGSIPGRSSTRQNKTYPKIKIGNYVGKAIVLISLVSIDAPYRAHPHNLLGEDCLHGVSTVRLSITEKACKYEARNLGVQYTKRHDVADSLAAKQKLRIDPFDNKFDHKDHPQSIYLKAVRLCFQAFLQEDESGRQWRPLTPVVSEIIYHKKGKTDKLLIKYPSVCSGTVMGGTEVFLLCENVTKEGVEVIFYQEENRVKVWEEKAIVTLVHKQAAIVFKTPAYKRSNITENVQVYYHVKRLSDNTRSKPMPFEYIPDFAEKRNKQRKDVSDLLQHYTLENWSPLHHNISSSPCHDYAPHYDQIRGLDNTIGSLGVPGPSYNQTMCSSNPEAVMVEARCAYQPYGQVSPIYMQTPANYRKLQMSQNMQSRSPNMQSRSPNMQALPTKTKHISPELQPLSSNMQPLLRKNKQISPELQLLSLYLESKSPKMQQTYDVTDYIWPNMVMSPQEETVSSEMQAMSPMDQMSPNISENIEPLSPNVEQSYVTTDNMWPDVLSSHGENNSPNIQEMSPMDQISPNMPQNMQPLSQNMHQTFGTSEHGMSPNEVMSPDGDTISPTIQVMPPMGSSSQDKPNMGHISPDSEQQKRK